VSFLFFKIAIGQGFKRLMTICGIDGTTRRSWGSIRIHKWWLMFAMVIHATLNRNMNSYSQVYAMFINRQSRFKQNIII